MSETVKDESDHKGEDKQPGQGVTVEAGTGTTTGAVSVAGGPLAAIEQHVAAGIAEAKSVLQSPELQSIGAAASGALSDPAITDKVETAVQTAIADAPAAEAAVGSFVGRVKSAAEHELAVAEAFIKGVVGKTEVSVGEVIAALVNRVHALEERLGIVKDPIIGPPK